MPAGFLHIEHACAAVQRSARHHNIALDMKLCGLEMLAPVREWRGVKCALASPGASQHVHHNLLNARLTPRVSVSQTPYPHTCTRLLAFGLVEPDTFFSAPMMPSTVGMPTPKMGNAPIRRKFGAPSISCEWVDCE